MGLLSKGKSGLGSQWGEQGRQSWACHGSQALPTGKFSRLIYRIHTSTVKPEFKSAVWDQQDPWPGSGMGSASLRQGFGARAGAQASPKWRGQSLMEPVPDALTQPLSLVPNCSQATSELAWPSQTSRQPNLQSGDEVLQGFLVHPGLGPLAFREGNLPFLAAFPLHASSYLQDCLCLEFPQHNAGFSPGAPAVNAPCSALSQLWFLGGV